MKSITEISNSVKIIMLHEILQDLKKVIVAYSGGVDSTLLLKIAYDILGTTVKGIYVESPLQPDRERQEALRIAGLIGTEIFVINVNPLSDEKFRKNPRNRCYYCKSAIFDEMLKIAREKGYDHVIDGSNRDDMSDYRPGKIALTERKIKSPLLEAGLTKIEIRALSKKLGLPTWNKDAYACLASRIPYNMAITTERLKRVNKAEEIFISKGYRNVRARYYGDEIRLEVRHDQVNKLREELKQKDISRAIHNIGFKIIAIDPRGYRQGNLND